MVEGELYTAVSHHDFSVKIELLALGAPEAGSGGDQGSPQGLGDVAGVDVAADYPWHHRPEGEEVVLGQHQYPDVVPVFDQLAEVLGRRVAPEAASKHQHLHIEVPVGGFSQGA